MVSIMTPKSRLNDRVSQGWTNSYCCRSFLVISWVTLFFVWSIPTIHCFAASTSNRITVKDVKSQTDVISLADLRYNEWIATANDDKESTISSSLPQPSLRSFRMATSEMVQERYEQGAIAFLAHVEINMKNDNEVVGAAELSPIEFDQCIIHSNEKESSSYADNNHATFLYVTDVVTSLNHRRMGIGNALMERVEDEASSRKGLQRDDTSTTTAWILLHVEHDNQGATKFYKKRGYRTLPTDIHDQINHDRFEENTGTNGQQLLLGKEITFKSKTMSTASKSAASSSGSGFGGSKTAASRGRKNAKKKKRTK